MNRPELHAGARIDNRYVLKEFKGSGSFGEVWLAEDEELGLDLAIKLYIILDEKGQEEFKEEYKITSNLNHQNLLTTKYYSVWDRRPFLTMKYCPNGSASKLGGNLNENEIWKFVHDVANGLSYLHNQEPPIIHQDIKPENILIDDQGTYLITDFGISKKLRSTMRKQSKRNVEQGAIAYMGPERFLAEPLTVKASDIWSLGVSIYELATDELPFMGQGGGMLNAGAALPNLNPKQYSANLNDVMRRCLAKDTWERPTAEQLVGYSDYVLKGGKTPFKDWVKSGPNPVQEPVWKKALKIGAISLGLAVVILIVIGILEGKGEDYKTIEQRYTNLTAMCESDINNGNAQNISSLVEASNLLDSLQWYRAQYPEVFENSIDNTAEIRQRLDAKKDEAQSAWMRAAKSQLSVPDYASAIMYLHNVLLIGENAEAKKELAKLASDNKCANMLVKSVKVDGETLRIDYDGLAGGGNVKVVYSVFANDDTANGINGQATVPVEAGKDKSVSIKLNGKAASNQKHVRLSENENYNVFYSNY